MAALGGDEESLEELGRSVLMLCGQNGDDADIDFPSSLSRLHPERGATGGPAGCPNCRRGEEGCSFLPVSPIPGPLKGRAPSPGKFCHSTPNPKESAEQAVLDTREGCSACGATWERERTFEEVLAEVSMLCEDGDSAEDDNTTVIENRGAGGRDRISKIDWSSMYSLQKQKTQPRPSPLTNGKKAAAAEVSQPGYFSAASSALQPVPGRFSGLDASHHGNRTVCEDEEAEEEEEGEDFLGLDRFVSFDEGDEDAKASDSEDVDMSDAEWVTLSKTELDHDITTVEPPQPSFKQESTVASDKGMGEQPCTIQKNGSKDLADSSDHDETGDLGEDQESHWVPELIVDSFCSDSFLTKDATVVCAGEKGSIPSTSHNGKPTPGRASAESSDVNGAVEDSIDASRSREPSSTSGSVVISGTGQPSSNSPSTSLPLPTPSRPKDKVLDDTSGGSRKRKLLDESSPPLVCAKSAKSFWAAAVKNQAGSRLSSRAMADVNSLVPVKSDKDSTDAKSNWKMGQDQMKQARAEKSQREDKARPPLGAGEGEGGAGREAKEPVSSPSVMELLTEKSSGTSVPNMSRAVSAPIEVSVVSVSNVVSTSSKTCKVLPSMTTVGAPSVTSVTKVARIPSVPRVGAPSVTSVSKVASVPSVVSKPSAITAPSVTSVTTKHSVPSVPSVCSVVTTAPRTIIAKQTAGRKNNISAEENDLMRQVRKRWETGIVRPDVNLTCCNYLRRRQPGATSLLEGNHRKPPLLRHLDGGRSGRGGWGFQQDFSSGCVSLLEELEHQLHALRQDYSHKVSSLKRELYEQVQEVLREQEHWAQWLQREQHKEREEVWRELGHSRLLQEHRLMLLEEEHHVQRQQQQQHYRQQLRSISQQSQDRQEQEHQRFQHLEKQLQETVQLFGRKDSREAGEQHVLVSLWKGPCRSNHHRRSWVQVGLPADIASYIWREDNIYDSFYTYQ